MGSVPAVFLAVGAKHFLQCHAVLGCSIPHIVLLRFEQEETIVVFLNEISQLRIRCCADVRETVQSLISGLVILPHQSLECVLGRLFLYAFLLQSVEQVRIGCLKTGWSLALNELGDVVTHLCLEGQ